MYLLCVLLMLPVVFGYSKGPPSERCDNMRPGHDREPQTIAAPFEITFLPDKLTYTANEQIQVTLKGKGSQKFKGFLIQPRPIASNYTTYGSIQSNPAGTRNPCSNERTNKNVALSHDSKTEKSSVTFTWMAPSSDVGNIVFVFSVVQDYGTFWVKKSSAALRYAQSITPTDIPTTAVTDSLTDAPTSGPVVTPTDEPTESPSSMINRDQACGITKGCFPAPSDCTTNCDYLVTWRESGIEDVEFTLQRKTAENNYWIAIGLSDDPKMGNDSVTECVSYDGIVDVKVSFNDPTYKMNRRLDTSNFGVGWIAGSYSNGLLSCTFTRKKTAAFAYNALGRRRREVADETTFFDLGSEWFLLVAHGNSINGNLMPHSQYPKISMTKIDFLTADTDTGTTPAVSATGIIKKDSRCGKSVGCYHDCGSSDSCGFLLTWMENGDDIDFTLTCKRGSNSVYCAIGLSKDNKMGDDSVFECVHSGGTASVFLSYNDGRSNNRLDQDKFGLSSISASYEDGILTCAFSRKRTASLSEAAISGRKKRATVASSATYFDMSEDWTLLYAYGSVIGGYISKHAVLPTVSSQKADFQSFMDISATTIDRSLIKLHGILMTVAWMFFAVFGIFMARFYKCVWPDGMEWCDQKRWFIVHRSCMVTAFLLTAASFVVIFVHVGGYAEIEGSGFEKSHPIIGIVVMCLALINPIMAVFRPHPGTPKRPVFNIFHKGFGTGAAVCSIMNIFSGTILTGAFVPEYVRIVLWVAIGWCALIEIISFVYDCQTQKENKGEAYELKPVGGEMEKQERHQNVPLFKIVILWLHLVILVGLTAGVCVLIAVGDRIADHDEHH
ncbi:uncharacterized protein LOC123535601 [Mercenaria mercenaria]|uniref:uncharacterized protein LOC123535601 n=1 Tax=Mercenaria mercenaria TaxID=6596 RepID=UPI00234E8DD2|nr:uncharacterized protein LOC123535601 [Mercenaria mercenaria]